MLIDQDEPNARPVKHRPVNPARRDSANSRSKHEYRANKNAEFNARPPVERLERAACIFLRLAILAKVKPAPGSPLHHFQMHDSIAGVHADHSTVHQVARELYGPRIAGLKPAHPALELLTILAGDIPPDTTDFPHVLPRALVAGYLMAKAMAREAQSCENRLKFKEAQQVATSVFASFFAWLARA